MAWSKCRSRASPRHSDCSRRAWSCSPRTRRMSARLESARASPNRSPRSRVRSRVARWCASASTCSFGLLVRHSQVVVGNRLSGGVVRQDGDLEGPVAVPESGRRVTAVAADPGQVHQHPPLAVQVARRSVDLHRRAIRCSASVSRPELQAVMPHWFSVRARSSASIGGGRRPAVQALGVVVPAGQVEEPEQQQRHPYDVPRAVVVAWVALGVPDRLQQVRPLVLQPAGGGPVSTKAMSGRERWQGRLAVHLVRAEEGHGGSGHRGLGVEQPVQGGPPDRGRVLGQAAGGGVHPHHIVQGVAPRPGRAAPRSDRAARTGAAPDR